jgi:hypothetical protein
LIYAVKKNYSPKDQKGLVQIKGAAYKEGIVTSLTRYPDCTAWLAYEGGSYKFANRSGCGAIWKSKADRMIGDFYVKKRPKIPWEKRAKRPC